MIDNRSLIAMRAKFTFLQGCLLILIPYLAWGEANPYTMNEKFTTCTALKPSQDAWCVSFSEADKEKQSELKDHSEQADITEQHIKDTSGPDAQWVYAQRKRSYKTDPKTGKATTEKESVKELYDRTEEKIVETNVPGGSKQRQYEFSDGTKVDAQDIVQTKDHVYVMIRAFDYKEFLKKRYRNEQAKREQARKAGKEIKEITETEAEYVERKYAATKLRSDALTKNDADTLQLDKEKLQELTNELEYNRNIAKQCCGHLVGEIGSQGSFMQQK